MDIIALVALSLPIETISAMILDGTKCNARQKWMKIKNHEYPRPDDAGSEKIHAVADHNGRRYGTDVIYLQ